METFRERIFPSWHECLNLGDFMHEQIFISTIRWRNSNFFVPKCKMTLCLRCRAFRLHQNSCSLPETNFQVGTKFQNCCFLDSQDSMATSRNSLSLPTLIYNNWTFFIGPSSSTLRKLNRWRWQFFSTGIKAWEVTFQLFFNDRLQNAEGRWVWPQAKPKNVRKKKEISQKKKREQLLWISVFAKTSSKKGLLFSTALMLHEFAVPTQKPHFTFSDLSIFRFFERCLCCWGEKKNLLLTPSWLQNFFPQAHWSELCYKKKRGNKSFVSGSADGDDWIFGA